MDSTSGGAASTDSTVFLTVRRLLGGASESLSLEPDLFTGMLFIQLRERKLNLKLDVVGHFQTDPMTSQMHATVCSIVFEIRQPERSPSVCGLRTALVRHLKVTANQSLLHSTINP